MQVDGTTPLEGPQTGQMATQTGRGPACSASKCLAFRFAPWPAERGNPLPRSLGSNQRCMTDLGPVN